MKKFPDLDITEDEESVVTAELEQKLPAEMFTADNVCCFLKNFRDGSSPEDALKLCLKNIYITQHQEISSLHKKVNDLKASFNEFAGIDELISAGRRQTTPAAALEGLVEQISKCIPLTACRIYLIDETTRSFNEILSKNMDEKYIEEIDIRLEEGTFAWAIREGGPVVIPLTGRKEHSLVICPLTLNANPIGTACFFSQLADSDYNPQIFQIIKSLAVRASMSISNALRVKMIQEESEKVAGIKDYLHLIVNSITQGIIVISNDDKISLFNRTAELMVGVEEKNAFGTNYQECLPAKLSTVIRSLLNRSRNEDPVVDYEFEFDRGEGVVFRLGITSIPLTDHNREFGSVLFSLRDLFTTMELTRLQQSDKYKTIAISRFKEDLQGAQKQLQKNEKLAAIGQMAAGVAHEINNPLGSIAGFIQILLLDADEKNDNHKYLSAMNQEVTRMKGIVDELLAFARQQPGTTEDSMPVSLNVVIEETIKLVEPQARMKQVEVSFNPDPDLPEILGHPDRLKQTIMNMCLNAFDAMSKKENTLTVKTCSRESNGETWADIIITDNGDGIRKEDLSKIFDPFFTTREQGQGTGLGLSTCYAIIEQHGGNIDVKTTWKEGTEFTISLPAGLTE
ncbi:MAG: ATP-binding protein [Planctomycetota bacterium]|jgi:PAS domain S-box-containing protein